MEALKPFECLPPFIHPLMLKRNGVNAVFRKQRMGFLLCSKNVKLLFQQGIHRGVQRKGVAGRLIHAKATVKIKAAGALEKVFNLGTAQSKLPGPFLIEIAVSFYRIVLGHMCSRNKVYCNGSLSGASKLNQYNLLPRSRHQLLFSPRDSQGRIE